MSNAFESGTGPGSVPAVMGLVLVALTPGVGVQALAYGCGTLAHVAVALVTALAAEALVRRVRSASGRVGPLDGSAAVTAVLIGVAIPAGAAWWVSAAATVFGLGVGKHAYGGLGQNPFNPAMAGYAFALVSFPAEMTRWSSDPLFWGPVFDWLNPPDGWSGATPLDGWRARRVRADLAGLEPVATARASTAVAVAYALGGAWLVRRRVIHWRLPIATLGTLAIAAAVLHEVEPARYASAQVHLASGAAVIAAFFIVTDPVTAPSASVAQWWYGAAIGAAVFAIRSWGGYPDGVAFAVLAGNMLTPALDRWTGAGRRGTSGR